MIAAQFRSGRCGLSFIIGTVLLSILTLPLGAFAATAPAPKISPNPASVSFSPVKVSGSSMKPVTIKNTGTADLDVGAITFTGTNPSQFGQTNKCSAPLLPNGTCTVSVTFSPTTPYGKKSATMNIASNDPKKPTATVKLSGQAPPPVISASPMSGNFTSAGLNIASSVTTVTIKNTGISSLNISSVTITGTNASLFAVTDTYESPLASGESCTVGVTFTPDSTGTKSASLQIASDDPKKPLAAVKLTGKTNITPSVVGTWSVSGPAIIAASSSGVSRTGRMSLDDSLSFNSDDTFTDNGYTLITGTVTPLDGTWNQDNYNYSALYNIAEVEQYFIYYLGYQGMTVTDITVTMTSKGSIDKDGISIKGKTTLMAKITVEYEGKSLPVTASATYSYVSSGFTTIPHAESYVDFDKTLNNGLLNKIADEIILSVREP